MLSHVSFAVGVHVSFAVQGAVSANSPPPVSLELLPLGPEESSLDAVESEPVEAPPLDALPPVLLVPVVPVGEVVLDNVEVVDDELFEDEPFDAELDDGLVSTSLVFSLLQPDKTASGATMATAKHEGQFK
jgi:hypothetical protein